jgi:chaperonin cofactor prefoldin
MSHYGPLHEQYGTDVGFNLDYSKTLQQNIIAKLSVDKEVMEDNIKRLELQLSIKDARISQLESVVIDLYHKIDRLLNETDEGENI